MTDLIMVRTLGTLRAADDTSLEALQRLPSGKPLKIKVSQPRSLPWLRRYWGLVAIIANNSSYSREDVHALLKLRNGCARPILERNGTVVWVPDSISFAKMTQDQWAVYWNKVVDYCVAELLPGISRKDLERELVELCGLPPLEFMR